MMKTANAIPKSKPGRAGSIWREGATEQVRDGVCFEKENAVANDTKSATTMVGVAGLEPAASWSRTMRDTKLRHTPIDLQGLFYHRGTSTVKPYFAEMPGKRKSAACGAFLERIMGIEPTYPAWEAGVLPMNYIRITLCSIAQREGKCKSIFRRSGISFPHASLPCRIPRLGLGIGLLQPGFQRILG